jgi:hypothetical protein
VAPATRTGTPRPLRHDYLQRCHQVLKQRAQHRSRTATAVVEAAKALIGPVSPPLPSRDGTTYYPLSSLRRDQYEVVFLMEGWA